MTNPMISHMIPLLLVAAFSAFSATTYISACSISIEGRKLWILRSLPLSVRDIFAAKDFY